MVAGLVVGLAVDQGDQEGQVGQAGQEVDLVGRLEEAREWAARVAEGCGWPQEVREVK